MKVRSLFMRKLELVKKRLRNLGVIGENQNKKLIIEALKEDLDKIQKSNLGKENDARELLSIKQKTLLKAGVLQEFQPLMLFGK